MSETRSGSSGHVLEAIIHFNEALDRQDYGVSRTEVAGLLFDGLNKLQTEWSADRSGSRLGEVKAFQSMVSERLAPDARDSILRSLELEALVKLEPRIMNHDTLTGHGYKPDLPIAHELRIVATEEHRRVVTAWNDLNGARDLQIGERLLKRVSELLYIVRSNIKHGEKTPYGPDLAKRKRDEQVSAIIVPILFLLVDEILLRPSHKLIAYGTLAPGQANHRILADISGRWEVCEVRGEVTLSKGLPGLTWSPYGSQVTAQLLISPQLPSKWRGLDSFEGEGYRRRLIPYQTPTDAGVAYGYLRPGEPSA
jgi:gamma-glutamylcyclotransferase (GGCT)/AIG2-like uncharacterized protein YtfP